MRLDTNGYYALGVPLYVALIALEMVLARRAGLSVYRFGDTLGNLSAGLGEVVLGLFLGPYLLALYDLGLERIALVRWPDGSLVPWVLAFVVGDLCYYWYHRAGHRVAALWAIHGIHHQSAEFNFSLAIRHPWLSDSYSALFYVPLPLLGVGAKPFFVAISLISLYALTVHSRVFHRPGLGVLVTPATHIVHHATNPRYLGKNYGAMFNVWDRLFGTHVEVDPADPPRLGCTYGYTTHDGALAQWIFFGELFAVASRARSWRDRIKTFVLWPGWRPPGVSVPRAAPARPDEAIPLPTKIYTAVQLALVIAFAMYVLWLRDTHPTWMLAASAAVILGGLSTIGGLLDGRASAPRNELVRLALTLAVGLVLAVTPRYAALAPWLAASGAVSAAWLWIAVRPRGPRPLLPS